MWDKLGGREGAPWEKELKIKSRRNVMAEDILLNFKEHLNENISNGVM